MNNYCFIPRYDISCRDLEDVILHASREDARAVGPVTIIFQRTVNDKGQIVLTEVPEETIRDARLRLRAQIEKQKDWLKLIGQ